MINKNKGGQVSSEGFLMFWRIVLVFFVILMTVWSLGNAFSSKIDIRNAETVLLSNKVSECLAYEGKISPEFELSDCMAGKEENFYVSANLISLESSSNKSDSFGRDYSVECALGEVAGFRNRPVCVNNTYYVLIEKDGKFERGRLNIFSAVARSVENVEG